MGFTINGVDVMSKYDTTYANESITTISGFKINGTDIGKSATPAVAGYTTDDPDTNDAFKTSNVSFNQLFSTSKPLVQLQGLASGGWIQAYNVGDYYFYDDIYWNNWRNLLRFTIPNVPGIQIPLRILIIGGGGGGGSGGGIGDGVGGGGAGTFLELTMTLNESHNQAYFRSHIGIGGGGGGSYSSYKGHHGAMGRDTYLQLRNASGEAINQYIAEGGAGGGGNGGHIYYTGDNGNPNNGRRGSGGGSCGAYGDNRAGGTAGDPTYLVDIYRPSEHPTTTVDAARAHDGGPGRQGNNRPGGGGGGAGANGGAGIYHINVGGTGGSGYTWINGNRYAGGGGGGNGNSGGGAPGNGDRAAGAGVNALNDRHAIHGTGSGGLGMYHDHYQSPHGGNGATGRVSIAVPRIFIDANYHTFTPLYN